MISRGDLDDDAIREQNKRSIGLVCSKYNSCRQRCHSKNRSINSQAYNCYCDDLCYSVYQDCCYDYELYCGKQHGEINSMVSLDKSMVSCTPGYETRGRNIWMVTKCSQGWMNKEILYKCQNVSKTNRFNSFNDENIYQYLPVVDRNGIVYQNVFCAQCNDAKNVRYFSFNIICSILPPNSISNLQEIISFVLEYCGYNQISIMLQPNQARRYCSNSVVHKCQISDSKKCRKNPAAIVTADHVNYKNIWCAQCNRVVGHKLSCGLEVTQGVSLFNFGRKLVPSFSLIMDNLEKWSVSSVSQICPVGQVFDSFLEICRRGKIIPPKKDFVDKYYVVIWLKNLFRQKPSLRFQATEFLAALKGQFDLNVTQISHVIIHKTPSCYIVEFELSLMNIQSLTVSIQSMEFNKELLPFANLLHFTRVIKI